jgi:hypothetical protein
MAAHRARHRTDRLPRIGQIETPFPQSVVARVDGVYGTTAVPPSVGKVALILLACWLSAGTIACLRARGGSSFFMVMPSESAVWLYALLAAGGFVIEVLLCLLLASIAHAIRNGSEVVVYGFAILLALTSIVVALS